MSLEDIEKLISENDTSVKSVQFKLFDKLIEQKQISFLDYTLHNNLSIIINNINHAYEYDLESGNAFYYEGGKLDSVFSENQVPYQDSTILNNYINIFNQTLEKLYPNKQSWTAQQIEQAVETSIQQFAEKNNNVNLEQKKVILNNLLEQYQNLQKMYENLENEAKKKSSFIIKMLIFGVVIQWGLFFYLTYGLYGWDFTEPVSYLWTLSIETFCLLYYIRRGRSLGFKEIFLNNFQKNKQKLLQKNISTNPQITLDFLKKRLKLVNDKIKFGN